LCGGFVFAGRYDRLSVSRWGEVAGHLNDLNSRGSETIRLPTESITREIKMAIMNLNDYLNGKVVPICDECKKELSPDEIGYGHDCEVA
jgi:hypothetical protein